MSKLAYSYEEAAEQVGYSSRTLRRAANDGMLVIRYGTKGKPVIRHIDLESWLESLPTEEPSK